MDKLVVLMDKWMNLWIDGWTNGQIDEWSESPVKVEWEFCQSRVRVLSKKVSREIITNKNTHVG